MNFFKKMSFAVLLSSSVLVQAGDNQNIHSVYFQDVRSFEEKINIINRQITMVIMEIKSMRASDGSEVEIEILNARLDELHRSYLDETSKRRSFIRSFWSSQASR